MFNGEIATVALSQPHCVNCLSDGGILPFEGFYLAGTLRNSGRISTVTIFWRKKMQLRLAWEIPGTDSTASLPRFKATCLSPRLHLNNIFQTIHNRKSPYLHRFFDLLNSTSQWFPVGIAAHRLTDEDFLWLPEIFLWPCVYLKSFPPAYFIGDFKSSRNHAFLRADISHLAASQMRGVKKM